MKEIVLTQGKIAIVDDDDYEMLMQYKWHWSAGPKGYGSVRACPSRTLHLKMHRLITKASKEFEVDHINNNPLDNRKSNLRLVNHAQNCKNQQRSARNKSGYKGVSWHKRAKKWQAHIMNNGIKVYLGLFENAKEAGKAYNIAALKHYGEFAKLNVIKD